MKILGFEFWKEKKEEETPLSFATPQNDDGAIDVGKAYGGAYSIMVDLDGQVKSESDLINKYRSISMQPELSQAIDEVVNEAISIDTDDDVVSVNLDKTKLSPKIKKIIIEEFDNILSLLNFNENGYDIFSKFYIDGRLNYYVMIDKKDLKRGIIELRYLDPRKVKLVREYADVTDQNAVTMKKLTDEYYVYFEGGVGSKSGSDSNTSVTGTIDWGAGTSTDGIKISKDSILRVTSGLMDESNKMVISWLHKAIRPLNQVRMLEDATLIYTLVRAPQRRAFYVDVGNLPRAKADQYLFEMMNRHKNKTAYDASTGEITDDRNILSMTEDYWFPRREGNRSTEVDTLDGGASITDNENLTYFKRNLYKSLNVPVSRLEPENMYSFGRTNEISREEVKFSKFITRLRSRFSILFKDALKTQLVLKNVMTVEEWEEIENLIKFDFNQENFFEELKELEILKERVEAARNMEDGIGKFWSIKKIRKQVLRQTEEEIAEEDKQMEKERKENPEAYGIGVDDDGNGGGNPFGGGNDNEADEPEEKEDKPNPFVKKKEKDDDEKKPNPFAKKKSDDDKDVEEDKSKKQEKKSSD